MKKFIRILSLCLIAVMLLSVLASCGDSKEKKKFVGTWLEINSKGEEKGEKLVLAKDGTGSVSEDGMSGSVKWKLDGEKVFITVSICGETQTQECTYEFSGDKMILTDDDGDETIYRKK